MLCRLRGRPWSDPPLVARDAAARFLRTARGGRQRHRDHMSRLSRLEAQAHDRERLRLEQRQRVLAARTQAPVLASYIRVRDLAKALRAPLTKVLQHTVTKSHGRFYLKTTSHPRVEYKGIKQIILPFRVAQQVAEHFGTHVAYQDMDPAASDASTRRGPDVRRRQPVIAVMGHVDHGKTTLMDTLRAHNTRPVKKIAPYEKHGITQKINVCEATVGDDVEATFLDTPGHFHFFRMRSSAAHVADAVLLIVAADEGVLLQTEESIGAVEEAGVPVVVCINKVDLLADDEQEQQMDGIVNELRSFVALQASPVVRISGKTGAGLDALRQTVGQVVHQLAEEGALDALVGPHVHAEGLVLESVAVQGRGTVLRVLIKHGILERKQHFVAGLIHGVVRSLHDAEGGTLQHAVPGTVVDVTYVNKSKHVDAPNDHGFFVLPEARAKQVLEQRELALEFKECLVPENDEASTTDAEYTSIDADKSLDTRSPEQPVDAKDPKPIIVKADGAGSLTTIQDTVDAMAGITTVRLGIGHISVQDIDVAINGKCPIFGFNVKLRRREAKLATERGVRVILRATVHDLIHEISTFEHDERFEEGEVQEMS
ncbi:hypothetical protein PsorP6_000894 [Peronosclerospora sorghi]|uniref:Uncharacterized protein n=2 Tax=Peronosclerospora sorghi TaxID=230839 RepID=A0ACC0WUX4_9STRA|nr:hypothetical protein PsorP6_000902 [Peronosclerospora sorghi]KAI9922574.1 hypothetical protein PsorP6_000894 [Peronosclerospora sorghi]